MSPQAALAPRARSRQCPHCESHYVARSRRQGIWHWPLIRLLGVHLYRCTECWRRFHAFGR
jgi:DNA-directed RNA polymerase subunit RPC12/RpoP